MLWIEHVNIRHLGFSKCYVVYCEVKCPFWLRGHFTSKLVRPFHLTLQYNAFFQLSLFFLMAPNLLALATTLENLGARRLLAKKVNFVPCTLLTQHGTGTFQSISSRSLTRADERGSGDNDIGLGYRRRSSVSSSLKSYKTDTPKYYR